MSEVVLKVKTRKDAGKKYAKQLRREGKIPGIYYAHEEKPMPLMLEIKELRQLKGSTSGLIDLEIDNLKPKKCIIKEIQMDPVKNMPIHLDLMGVSLKEKITLTVPVKLVGESVGVKEDGGTLVSSLHELEISCLPLDIPESIPIEVARLKIGDSVHVKDLKFEKFEIMNDPESVIVGVTKVRAAVIAEEAKPIEPTEEAAKEEPTEEKAQ